MKTTTLLFALAAAALAASASAAERTPLSAEARAQHDAAVLADASDRRARVRATHSEARPKAVTEVLPGTPYGNPFRAYPPSCAADPLPDAWTNSTPRWSANVGLYSYSNVGPYIETVNVSVWRIACSSSGAARPYNESGAYNAMTLVRFSRSSEFEGNASAFPTFPIMRVVQNGSPSTGSPSLVRVAPEPNTVVAETVFNSPIIDSTTYVLENYPYEGYGYFTFSDAFTLIVNPGFSDGSGVVSINVPAYNPTNSTYPAAFQPREIDGYAAAQYLNSELGEGLLLQVTEQYDAQGSMIRQVVFDLLTLDLDGYPMWLIGNAAFEVGQKTLTLDLAYLDIDNQTVPWGTATIEIPDCNHLEVDFEARTDLPDPIFGFDGLTEYTRIFEPNGLLCE